MGRDRKLNIETDYSFVNYRNNESLSVEFDLLISWIRNMIGEFILVCEQLYALFNVLKFIIIVSSHFLTILAD